LLASSARRREIQIIPRWLAQDFIDGGTQNKNAPVALQRWLARFTVACASTA
jgi:hypothetical protein